MQCTGSYPAPLSEANLNVIKTYKKKFNCLVGYSDHVMGILDFGFVTNDLLL